LKENKQFYKKKIYRRMKTHNVYYIIAFAVIDLNFIKQRHLIE